MAVDLTAKTLNLASEIVTAADQLMAAFERFEAILAEKESSGLDFNNAAFLTALQGEGSSLRHVDGNMLNNALSNSASIYAAMKAGFQDDVFQALRP